MKKVTFYKHLLFTSFTGCLLFSSLAFSVDTDTDGVDDVIDNCTLISNANQRDTNSNGFGNVCDGDLTGNGIINWNDINRTYWYFGVLGDHRYNPDADINGDNIVNSRDADLIRAMMNNGGVPGPSAGIIPSINTAPTIVGQADTSITVDMTYSFTPSAADADGDTLTFTITNTPTWAHFDSTSGIVSGTPQVSDVGSTNNIIITVSDGQASASLSSFSIEVVPTAANGDTDNDTIFDSVDNCTLVANIHQRDTNGNGFGNVCDGDLDNDGDIDWNDINRTYWYFGVLGDNRYNPDADINGDNIVNSRDADLIRAMMNNGGVPGPSAGIIVAINMAPTITGLSPSLVQTSTHYSFRPTANDADGDRLSFSITNIPPWAQFNTETGMLEGTPTLNDIGTSNDIVIQVSDGQETASLTAFSITVQSISNQTTPPTIAGCQIFPSDNFWNTPIIDYPLHPKSADYINNIGATTALHPDFGDGERINGELQSAYGIAYVVVSNDANKYQNNPDIYKKSDIPVTFRWWDESDCQISDSAQGKLCTSSTATYPAPAQTLAQFTDNVGQLAKIIESGTDRHLIAIDADTCQLYEVQRYNFNVSGNTITDVTGDSGAIWDLSVNEQRVANHTSADAAGLAIFPGLIKFDEIFKKYDLINGHQYGQINHAIRITLNNPQNAYIFPATHSDGNQQGGCQFSADSNCLPMGQKLRLKMTLEEIDNSDFSAANKIILTAMKTYGVVVADTGGDMFISGDHDPRWVNADINALKTLTAGDFEAVIKPLGHRVHEYSWTSNNSVFYTPVAPDSGFGDDEFEFVVFGDFNQGGCERNERVVELINLMANNENDTAAFYVSTGDLIDGYIDQRGGNLSFGANIDNSGCGINASAGNIKQILAPIKERPTFDGLSASFSLQLVIMTAVGAVVGIQTLGDKVFVIC